MRPGSPDGPSRQATHRDTSDPADRGHVRVLLVIGISVILGVAGAVLIGRRPPSGPASIPTSSLEPSTHLLEQPRPARPVTPWNVILISLDTLRSDHLSAYGYGRPTSPEILRFADEAVVFEQAFSHAPKTAPSHMSLMTGLHPGVHGVRNSAVATERRLSAAVPTLATILQGSGYRTMAVTNGGMVRASLGFDRGFDAYHEVGDVVAAVDGAIAGLDLLVRPGPGAAGSVEPPFFMFVHTYETHTPYAPPAPLAGAFTDPTYRGRIPPNQDALALLMQAHGSALGPARFFMAQVDRRSATDLRHLQDLYDAEILWTDQHVGRLLDQLRSRGFDDRTIVIILSDHGEEFLEHGSLTHQTLYRQALQVPLLIRAPGGTQAAPRRVPTVVRLVDVMPTILDLLGLPIPGHVQGRSLVPLMRGQTETADRWVLSETRGGQQRALRIGSWKLVRTPTSVELYDVQADPDERHDVHSRHPEVARALRQNLERLVAASAALAAAASPGAAHPIDDETRRRLEALGYVARGG